MEFASTRCQRPHCHSLILRPLALWPRLGTTGAFQTSARLRRESKWSSFLAWFPRAKRFAEGLYSWVIPVTYTTGIHSVLTASPVFALRIALWFINCYGCRYFILLLFFLFRWIPNFLLQQRLEWMGRTAVDFLWPYVNVLWILTLLPLLPNFLYAGIVFPSFLICF